MKLENLVVIQFHHPQGFPHGKDCVSNALGLVSHGIAQYNLFSNNNIYIY